MFGEPGGSVASECSVAAAAAADAAAAATGSFKCCCLLAVLVLYLLMPLLASLAPLPLPPADIYKGKIGVDKEEAAHLLDHLDWKQAVGELKEAVAFLHSRGAKKVGATGGFRFACCLAISLWPDVVPVGGSGLEMGGR